MAYAPEHRAFYDADSHIMELPDFLQKYADPELRADIPAVSYAASLVTDEEVAEIMDISVKATYKIMSRALLQLKQTLSLPILTILLLLRDLA